MSGSIDSDPEPLHSSQGASIGSFDLVDPVACSAYVARFDAEVAGLRLRRSSEQALQRAAARTRIVLLGEYHALDSACRTARWLIERTVSQHRALLLGLEMVHARDQRALNDHQQGRGGEALLLRRMRYRQEWGYPWAGPRALLRSASACHVPVFGLDMPPRGGVEDLALRDEAAVERLAHRLTEADPRALAIVVFGEAHLAQAHLPALLLDRLGNQARLLRVLHDVPYVPALQPGIYSAGDTFVVQRHPPAARERAMARTYRNWAADLADADEFDHQAMFHALLTHAAAVLGIDPRRERVAGGARLVDLFPEVVAMSQGRRGVTALQDPSVAQRGGKCSDFDGLIGGWNWRPEAQVVLVSRPGVRAAAIEAGRFLAAHLRGGLSAGCRTMPGPSGHIVEFAVATAIAAWADSGLRRLGPSAISDGWLPQYPASTRVQRAEAAAHRALSRGETIRGAFSHVDRHDQPPIARLLGYRYGIALARKGARRQLSLARLIGLARWPLDSAVQGVRAFESLRETLRD